MQTRFSFRRFLNTLGGRVSAVIALIVVLMLIGGILIGAQLRRISNATAEAQASTRYLEATLSASHQTAKLVTLVQQGIAKTPDKDRFVRDVTPTLLALENQRALLREEARRLPPGSTIQARMASVATVLGNVTDLTREVIRHVDRGDWELARYTASQLIVNYQLVEQESDYLVILTRTRYEQSQAEVQSAVQRIVRVIPLITVLVIFFTAGISVVSLRGIITGIGLLSRSAQRLAEGYLEERIPFRGLEEFRYLAQTFNNMAAELQQLYTGLERLVAQRTAELARRTNQLEAAAYVARQAAEIRDLDTLLNETVRLISDRFGFYHAGIFLVDEMGEYAVLRAASSEGGQRMLSRGHKLAVGKVGIVGYVAATGKPRIALDVGADAVFFDNPDLPLTRSEMALPLKIGEQVIGVLDVQSVEPEAFTEEDVAILQTLADQVSIAIQSARLLEESHQRLRELEMVYGERARLAWREWAARRPVAYRYTGVEVQPFSGPATIPASAEPPDGHHLTIPLRLWGQTIGSILLQRTKEQPPWTPEEQRLAEDLGEQIAQALENARLIAETENRATGERMISEVTSRLTRALDMDALLETAVRELARLPEVMEVAVYVGSPEISPARERSRRQGKKTSG